MNEEEIEAIQILNNFNPVYCGMEEEHAIETILKLVDKQQKEIEKQQKEIERIEKKLKRYQKYLLDSEKKCDKLLEFEYTERERDYISKDKIKGKMKELEEMPENQYIHLHYVKKMLDELLGE